MTEPGVLKPGVSIRPIIDVEESKILVEALYGLRCLSITELNGYDDKNYKVLVNDSVVKNANIEKACRDGYVLKIMNSLDSKKLSFVEAQNALMLYLSSNGITCPRPVKNKNEQYYSVEKFVSGEHVVRLLEFLPGSILHQVPPTPRLSYQCGRYAATLDFVLKKFHHPAFDTYQSIWKLDSVPQLPQFLFAIKDLNRKQVVEEVIQQFNHRVLIVRENLEKGLIHGDFNEQNIVVENVNGEWNLKGILDFGDSHHSCYLFELAIIVTYIIILAKDLDAAGYVLAGYSKVRIPTDQEFSLLKVCVAARLCQSVVIGAYSSLEDPGNSYILTTQAAGWDILMKLWAEPEDKLLARWKTVAENYKQEVKD